MSWQKILAQGFASARELLTFLHLPLSLANDMAEQQFKTRVPRGFAARMQPHNPQDPLLLQVLATSAEIAMVSGYSTDPLVEAQANPIPGLIHKYQGRLLLTVTGVCAINCRYCFRRHFPYQDNNPGRQGWHRVVDYIRQDTSLHEVIFSGGDPLLASDQVLADLVAQLETIEHIRTLRIHTRIPIVLPERIDSACLAWLHATRLRKVVVVHCNHAQEIDDSVTQALQGLRASNCHLLNQSVLLKGVNDCAKTLARLSDILFDNGVLPYYLHVLDKVAGAAHFDLTLNNVQAIYRQLQTQLPGYLVPRLVCEEAGKPGKTLLLAG